MAQKKYVSLSKLGIFLENLTNKFAAISHKHSISDITDFAGITVDSELSPTSTNPVQNRVLEAEFEAISDGMGVLEEAINDKADALHTHTISDVTNLQTTLDAKVPASRKVNGKALTNDISLSASDVNAYSKTEIDNFELITVDDIDAICGTTIQVATASEVTF